MKKSFLVILTTLAALFALTATAERKIWIYSNQGNHISMDVTEMDSISFEEPGYLILDPEAQNFSNRGGSFIVHVTANKSWTAQVSDSTALFIGQTSGTGEEGISVFALANDEEEPRSAILTITLSNGQYKQLIVTVEGKVVYEPLPEKCNASDYPQVTIGTQTWMAENYRCSRYDTESEAYWTVGIKYGGSIPTSEYNTDTPYYTDASDKSKWFYDNVTMDNHAGNITDTQAAKLGYLYNWAAAVGIEDGDEQTTAFVGNRQGICPNGWHIPTSAEWQILQDYIENTQGKGSGTAGKHLKTTSGWYEGDTAQYPQGIDTYGFAALPAALSDGCLLFFVGEFTYFWTATLSEDCNGCAYIKGFNYYNDFLNSYSSGSTSKGQSVRCLKN